MYEKSTIKELNSTDSWKAKKGQRSDFIFSRDGSWKKTKNQ